MKMPVPTENLLLKLRDRPDLLHEIQLKYDLSYWSEHIRGFENPPHIQEWSGLIDKVLHGGIKRLCVIAPGTMPRVKSLQ